MVLGGPVLGCHVEPLHRLAVVKWYGTPHELNPQPLGVGEESWQGWATNPPIVVLNKYGVISLFNLTIMFFPRSKGLGHSPNPPAHIK
jgi:hypothetical protein